MKASKRTYVVVSFDSYEAAKEFYDDGYHGKPDSGSVSMFTDCKMEQKILAALVESCDKEVSDEG